MSEEIEKKKKVKETPKVAREIEITGKPQTDAEKLIAKAKKEIKKPKSDDEKKKKKRGRPPKKGKPDLDMTRYGKMSIAKTVNSFLVRVGNGIIGTFKQEPLTPKEKLTLEDCEIGESLCYMFEYYGLELTHPIIVILMATGMFGWAITDRMLGIKEQKDIIAGRIQPPK